MTPPEPQNPDFQPDVPAAIEDEPYHGLYREKPRPLHETERAPQADRFDLADILKSRREALGWSLDDVAEITRVKRSYLEALEQAAYDVLPPRAFALGFVKAYAKALGLDEESLADMFRREVSPQNTRLHAPSGASLEDAKPSYRRYIVAAGCLVAAIVAWNIWQHQPGLHARRGVADIAGTSWAPGVPLIHDGAIYVTRPQPAPPDQDVPVPYVTPGLEAQFASLDAQQASSPQASAPDALTRKAFNPRGAVYGADPEDSVVTIQATRSVNLVLRDGNGNVYFVHQFSPGEAYRLPQSDQQAVLLDVSDPSAFDMFYNGEYAGALEANVTPVGKVNARAMQLSNALDARQANGQGNGQSNGQAAARPDLAPPPVVTPKAELRPEGPIPYLPAVRHKSAASDSSAASSAGASQ